MKVPDAALRPQESPPGTGPNYFLVAKDEPNLMVSGWLEPAEQYEGLDAFWKLETSSPVYSGIGAPTQVEKLRVGPWEVVAYDIPLPADMPGASAHLRAERVQAGTWIDLHLSSTAGRPAADLRKDLIAVLQTIEVAEKK